VSVAAVDVGSNSIRLLVLADDGSRVLRRITTTRLAEGVDRTGNLADAAIERSVAAIVEFRSVWEAAGVRTDAGHVRIAATSAVRDAQDRDRFLRAVRDAVGIDVEVISGAEEAALGLAGTTAAVRSEDPCLVIDVGGGSTEMVVGRDGIVLASVSTQIGCVRLTERELHHDPPTGDELRSAGDTVDAVISQGIEVLTTQLDAHGVRIGDVRTVVAIAGTATTLAALALGLDAYEESRIHGTVVGRDVLEDLAARLAAMDVAERAALGPVQSGRAEVLHGGALVLSRALRLLGRPELVVSESDSLDALAAGLLRGPVPQSAPVPSPGRAFWDRLESALAAIPKADRTPPPGARIGAVLVLLEDGPGNAERGPRLVLTRRRPDLRSHPGQLSFAGGRMEPGENPARAALREAAEEIGLDPATVTVLGDGPTFYIPPSRFWVVPVIARWHSPHPLVPEPREVAEVLHVDLAELTDERRWRHTPIASSTSSAWAWQLDDDLLWGATALVVRMLLDTTVPDWAGGRSPESLGPERETTPWAGAPKLPRRARLGSALPERDQDEVPHVGVREIRAVRAWLDAHGVGPGERAEQAGRAVTVATQRFLAAGQRTGSGGPITVLAGPSSNGSGGLVAARLLAAAGHDVAVITVGAPRIPAQTHLLRELRIPVVALEEHPLDDVASPGALVIDAMLGVGSRPPMHGRPAAVADWLRRHDVPVIALDVPSGLSPDRGLRGPCVTADVTIALGLPTGACAESGSQAFLGDLHLADLGAPAAAWAAVGVEGVPLDLFADGGLVRLMVEAAAGDAGTPMQTA
jgi:exopolyphosphatase/guanosine-5'-triphosphate,3'-diphosphate pyrophosphatase